ncbi:hypothetical protein ACHAXA_005046 [Cyclostephanos tholiformis]|uniref:Uncharacterized protein n=1 Tax=Cyclostephanos tholiformis TaxID=382380 RepID=A0ABD3SRR1_9STRA
MNGGRYYDDLKHVDHNYIDYGLADLVRSSDVGERRRFRRLIVEQRKRLGKGGLCWDAAFVLGEHVAHNVDEWRNDEDGNGDVKVTRILELGAGTGLCGLMIGTMVSNCHVELTDLPELQDLMSANIERNTMTLSDVGSNVSCRVLRWGVDDDYVHSTYDVVLGADVVTSIYDPIALARTFHALSGPNTMVYVSGKARLDKPHEVFEAEMEVLFAKVRKVERPCSRLRSPNVFVIVANGKR